MRTKEEVHEILDEWMDSEAVGNIMFYHAPQSNGYEAIIEKTVKAREMHLTTRAAFEMFMDDMEIERGTVFRNKDGEPDRVTLTRRFDIG